MKPETPTLTNDINQWTFPIAIEMVGQHADDDRPSIIYHDNDSNDGLSNLELDALQTIAKRRVTTNPDGSVTLDFCNAIETLGKTRGWRWISHNEFMLLNGKQQCNVLLVELRL